jgi:hypothetical protein
MDIPITRAQLERWTKSRETIQSVLPHLTAAQREFLISGITPDEWSSLNPTEDPTEEEPKK